MSDAPDDDPPEDTVAIAARAAAGIGGVFALAALALYGPRTASSVLVGAAIAVANIVTMRVIIRSLLPPPGPEEPTAEPEERAREARREERATKEEPGPEAPDEREHEGRGRRGGAVWGVLAAIKMLLLFGGIWILLTRHVVDPMPLLVGYGAMPLGIVVSALWPSLGRRR